MDVPLIAVSHYIITISLYRTYSNFGSLSTTFRLLGSCTYGFLDTVWNQRSSVCLFPTDEVGCLPEWKVISCLVHLGVCWEWVMSWSLLVLHLQIYVPADGVNYDCYCSPSKSPWLHKVWTGILHFLFSWLQCSTVFYLCRFLVTLRTRRLRMWKGIEDLRPNMDETRL